MYLISPSAYMGGDIVDEHILWLFFSKKLYTCVDKFAYCGALQKAFCIMKCGFSDTFSCTCHFDSTLGLK